MMSYWEHQKPVQRARVISVSDLERAALKLLGRGGLDALTIRAAAGELGVAPSSLYSRVRGIADLCDLALDAALREDPEVAAAMQWGDAVELMLAHYRHLLRHPWASRVIAMRAPRGPNSLRFSERLCVLLIEAGFLDPLTTGYALANLVLGSASTDTAVARERAARVDPEIAPRYAELHAAVSVAPEEVLRTAIFAILSTGRGVAERAVSAPGAARVLSEPWHVTP